VAYLGAVDIVGSRSRTTTASRWRYHVTGRRPPSSSSATRRIAVDRRVLADTPTATCTSVELSTKPARKWSVRPLVEYPQPGTVSMIHSLIHVRESKVSKINAHSTVRKRLATTGTHCGSSHSVACHPAEVTFQPLPQPVNADTRFVDPGRMKG